jgi:hypothetical protein
VRTGIRIRIRNTAGTVPVQVEKVAYLMILLCKLYSCPDWKLNIAKSYRIETFPLKGHCQEMVVDQQNFFLNNFLWPQA